MRTFEELKEMEYGPIGTPERDKHEREAAAFRQKVMEEETDFIRPACPSEEPTYFKKIDGELVEVKTGKIESREPKRSCELAP